MVPGENNEEGYRPPRSFGLAHGEAPSDGLRRIGIGRSDHALEQLRAARGDDWAVRIHSARKDLKKLRAVLRLVRSDLGKKLYKAEDGRYRNAARGLSEARDAEVRLQTLRGLRERYPDEFPPRGANRLEKALLAERDALVRGARAGAAGRLRVVAKQIEDGRDVIDTWPLETDRWRLVGPGLTDSYKKGRKLYRVAIENPTTDNVHEWRKRVKDLRYQVTVIRTAWESVLGGLASETRELGDVLGEHHDLGDLIEEARRRQDVISKPMTLRLEALAQRRETDLMARAAQLGERIYAESPKEFERRIGSYWKAWRAEAAREG